MDGWMEDCVCHSIAPDSSPDQPECVFLHMLQSEDQKTHFVGLHNFKWPAMIHLTHSPLHVSRTTMAATFMAASDVMAPHLPVVDAHASPPPGEG